MSCATACSKCVLLLCYTLLWVAAAVFTFVGTKTVMLANAYDRVSESAHIRVSGICVLVAGILLFVVGLIGVIAYCKRSQCLLVVFYCFLLIILFCEIGAVLLSVLHWAGISDALKKILRMELDAYGKDSNITSDVDNIQKTLKCCGVNSYNDWNSTDYFIKNQKFPESCYPPGASMSEVSTTTPLPPVPYSDGCCSVLEALFHSKSTLIIATGVMFILLQVLGLHGSCIVLCHSQPTLTQRQMEGEYARI
ncbi:unnamed protein product [Calicophoron daubneyi]|uniref:Tetraspanin n=1 Tax=Calicophoron daubneyi TaxID=300641 RepID=A0AAV2TR78_CALDB